MSSKFLQIFLFGLLLTISANATTCSKSYTLGFFNGVWNTEQQADKGLKALSQLVGDTYNKEPVNYKTFYNHTAPGYDVLGLQDVAETFIQRAAEIDASGEFGKRFEYFWEFMGSSEPTFIDKIKGIFPNAVSLFDSFYTLIMGKLTSIISYFLSNPPTETDYASHNAKLDALAADGQKLMLVGHSQGNLFMNHAYDHILPTVGADRVKAAHIAPASPTLRGDYVLANIDLVINALRIQGVTSVPVNNLDINASRVDVSGHTLIGTYLDPTRDGRGQVKTMIVGEMGKLECPSLLQVTRYIYFRYMDLATALAEEQAKLRYPYTLDPVWVREFSIEFNEFKATRPDYEFGAPGDFCSGPFKYSHYGGDLYTLFYNNGTTEKYRKDRIIDADNEGGRLYYISTSQLPDLSDYIIF
ncbi:MAG: hypothetical protein Q8R86_08465 [Sulfuricurvum sp.]|nr:hypothetical protein [Sulfuricurvum sp.]